MPRRERSWNRLWTGAKPAIRLVWIKCRKISKPKDVRDRLAWAFPSSRDLIDLIIVAISPDADALPGARVVVDIGQVASCSSTGHRDPVLLNPSVRGLCRVCRSPAPSARIPCDRPAGLARLESLGRSMDRRSRPQGCALSSIRQGAGKRLKSRRYDTLKASPRPIIGSDAEAIQSTGSKIFGLGTFARSLETMAISAACNSRASSRSIDDKKPCEPTSRH